MSKSIFISIVHEDSHLITTLNYWAKTNRLGDDVIITHETQNDKRYLGKELVKEAISRKIEGSALVFVLIGKDTHNHDWIQAEVEVANKHHKKIICVRIPQTNGAPPAILSKYKIIVFEPNAIKQALEQI